MNELHRIVRGGGTNHGIPEEVFKRTGTTPIGFSRHPHEHIPEARDGLVERLSTPVKADTLAFNTYQTPMRRKRSANAIEVVDDNDSSNFKQSKSSV